jgi:carboxyl-terminal processing protease
MKPYTFSDGSMMRLTTSKYYTPSGRCIQKEYGASKDSYDKEIFERSQHGELFSEDSIDVSTDLIYKTASGRTVYGGGGIIPDIFVPADTILSSDVFQEIFKSGAFIDYSMDYTEKNRTGLSTYPDVNSLIQDSVLEETIVKGFEQYLMDKEIITAPLAEITHPYMSRQLLAFISRNLWDDIQYHKAINSNQAIIIKALEVINNKEFNWDELSDK